MTVIKVTPKKVWTSAGVGWKKESGRSSYLLGTIRVPTAEDLATRKIEIAGRARKQEEAAAYRNREDVQLADRLCSVEADKWFMLGVDKLKEIAAMLEGK